MDQRVTGWLWPQVWLRPQDYGHSGRKAVLSVLTEYFCMLMPPFVMQSGLASQFCPGWLFFSKMGFVGKGGKEPMAYVSREGCVLVKTNLSLMKDTECRLSDFSMGRQGKHQFCSVNKSNMLEVVRDGARYVKLSDGYHAVTKQLPKQIQDGPVWLLNYLTDWDGLWDWNCQVVKAGLASQFCPGWLFFSKMGFVGKGGMEPMVYVSREGCVDTECRLSDFSMGRQGKHQVGSVNKRNMLEVVRDGARYVNSELNQSKAEYIAVELVGLSWSDSDKAVRLFFREKLVFLSDGYRAVTKQLPKQIQDSSVWLLNYLTDWDGLWDWNCQVVMERLPNRPIKKETVWGVNKNYQGRLPIWDWARERLWERKNRQLRFLVGFPRIRKGEAILDRNRENRERKGETDGEGLISARSTDRILSPTTLEFSGGLTDRLRCVGFWPRVLDETGISSTTEEQRWSAIGTVLRSRIPCVPGSCRSQKNGFGEEIRFGRAAYMEIFKPHVIYQDVPMMVERANNFNDIRVAYQKEGKMVAQKNEEAIRNFNSIREFFKAFSRFPGRGVSIGIRAGLASQFCPGWLFFFRNWDLWVRVEWNPWSMSRAKNVWQGKHQVGSVNKSNMLEVERDGARYVNSELDQSKAEYIAVELVGLSWSDSDKAVGLFFREKLVYLSDGYRAVTKQLPKQIQDGSVWLLNYLTDWDGLWDWNCQVVMERLPNRPIEKETVWGVNKNYQGRLLIWDWARERLWERKNRQLPFLVGFPRIRKGEAILDRNRENRERKGETDGEGLRSARSTDRILSPTTLEFSGGLTDRLRCVGFWFEDTKQVVNRKNRSVFGHGS
ncbi:hypothetical protein F2Q69_00034260 [Brassica cretica]|uniref:Uncharacterized protein n=1 Tax=Brassica cretica TaxID=69181 RepID=A0A8S9SMD9_BRACR|nr:hypothetical protein F2Q69_00034260 [Brassica cretica]